MPKTGLICIKTCMHRELRLGPIDALNHLLGLFLPAFVVGPLAAALAKAVWRRELRAVRWRRLALWALSASALASIGGLAAFGRDGMMATYGAMVIACALAPGI